MAVMLWLSIAAWVVVKSRDIAPPETSDLAVRMEPISLKARDGLPLHGYLTFLAWGERKDLPMVLSVHGGPWGRDTWGYRSADLAD